MFLIITFNNLFFLNSLTVTKVKYLIIYFDFLGAIHLVTLNQSTQPKSCRKSKKNSKKHGKFIYLVI